MTSYLFEIGSRRRKTSRFIGQIRDEIVRAFVHEKISTKITQDTIAAKLGIDKSVVSRDLNKYVNMTASKMADYAWALDYDITIKLDKKASVSTDDAYELEGNDIKPGYEFESEFEQLVEA